MLYNCNQCNKEFILSSAQVKAFVKDIDKKFFCSLKCSGKFYAKKSHDICDEEKALRNKKISETLKARECQLSEQEKSAKVTNLNSFWENLTEEQRSIRNKNLVDKSKQTKLLKYGSCNYNNSEKAKMTYKLRYNEFNPAKNYNHLSTECLSIIRDRDKLINYIFENISQSERCIHTIAQSLGISDSYCNTLIIKYDIYNVPDIKIHRNISRPQLELQEYITTLVDCDIIINTKKVIPPLELDIYIPDKQVALEFNGSYYHGLDKVSKDYHHNKSKLCEDKGIRLIHIFEYEWNNERQQPILKNIIKNALGVNNNKLYARQLNIEVRNSVTMKEFFNKNNIQGFRPGKFAICLVDKETKEVYMSYMMGSCFFGKGKYEWEVIRGATKLGYTVVGGASRIWSYFIKNYNPQSCVYYVDYNYFNGNSLDNLPHMEFITTQLSFKNYFVNEGIVKNRDPQHHKQVVEGYNDGTIIPIYNAGTKVYVWKK